MLKILFLLPLLAFSDQNLDLKYLQSKLSSKVITVDDPVYKKKKTFEGFLLTEVIKLLNLKNKEEEIEFHCLDGYKPVIDLDLIEKGQPYLVYRDVEFKDWEEFEVGKSKKTPGPFYLIWPSKIEEANWPYQVIGIYQVDFSKKYSKTFPQNLKKNSEEIKRGFHVFRKHCLKCHSINLEGGELGPELNIPKNITEYRSQKYLKEFILDSNSFRLKSPMPPFKDILTNQEIGEVLSYISWMKRSKFADPAAH